MSVALGNDAVNVPSVLRGEFSSETETFLIERHKQAEDAGNKMLNDGIRTRWVNLNEYLTSVKENRPSVPELQKRAGEEYRNFLVAFTVIRHYIAMKQPTIESGDEFGSAVQASVVQSIEAILEAVEKTYDRLVRLLEEMLRVEVKYGTASNKVAYETYMNAMQERYNVFHDFLLSDMADCYAQMIHAIKKNYKLITQPKNHHTMPMY